MAVTLKRVAVSIDQAIVADGYQMTVEVISLDNEDPNNPLATQKFSWTQRIPAHPCSAELDRLLTTALVTLQEQLAALGTDITLEP